MYKFSSDPHINTLCENFAARCGEARLVPENLSVFDLQPEVMTTKPSVGGNGFVDGFDLDEVFFRRILLPGKLNHTVYVMTTYIKALAESPTKPGSLISPYAAMYESDYSRFMDWWLPNGKDSKPFAVYQAMMIFVRSASMTWGNGFASIVKSAKDFYIDIPKHGRFGIENGELVGLVRKVKTAPLSLPLNVLMYESVDDPVIVRPDVFTALSVFVGENPEIFPNWLEQKKLLCFMRFMAPTLKQDIFWRRVKKTRDVAIEKRLIQFTIKEVQSIRDLACGRIRVAHMQGAPFLRAELADMLDPLVIRRGSFARLVGKPHTKGRDRPNKEETARLIEKITAICNDKVKQLEADLAKLDNKK